MDQTMPSFISEGQIDRISDSIRAALRKNKSKFLMTDVQEWMEGLGEQFIHVYARRIKKLKRMIVFDLEIDRAKTPAELLEGSIFAVYPGVMTIGSIPNSRKSKEKIYFFNCESSRPLLEWEYEREFELRGLIPADPHLVVAANLKKPEFHKDHLNGTFWKNTDGTWNGMIFDTMFSLPSVTSGKNKPQDQSLNFWFAGMKKKK